MRRVAWFIAVGWHVLVAAMLVWLMYQQYLAPANPPRKGQEDVVQVEFLGQGSPEEVGGGPDQVPAPQAAAAEPAASAQTPESAATRPPESQPQTVETPTTVTALPPPTAAAPENIAQPSPAEASQSVQVSEPVPDNDTDYVLPPPMPRLQITQVTVPDRHLQAPEVSVIELPGRPTPSLPAIAPRPVPEITVEQTVADVVVREIPTPLPAAPTTRVTQPAIAVTDQQLRSQPVRERSIPSPPSAGVAAGAVESSSSDPARSGTTASASQTIASGAASAASAATAPSRGAGPGSAAAPGGWSSPRRAHDWGDSTRDVAGGRKGDPSGLYNSDGSVRLAKTPGSAAPARPPGTVTDEIVNLDRGGTWLKRKPTDYEPTAFDRYWRPNESLLEEWVRKSITTVRIPIPGTNKHVVCTTVMLVMGGACDITDPNLLDVAATARPAPDIPFKPALQEDNGSLPDPVE